MSEMCKSAALNEENINISKKVVDNTRVEYLEEMFKVLASRTRLKILFALSSVSELCVCELTKVLDMEISSISHQLRRLKQFDIVKSRKEGKAIYYSLKNCDHVQLILKMAVQHLEEN